MSNALTIDYDWTVLFGQAGLCLLLFVAIAAVAATSLLDVSTSHVGLGLLLL